MISMGCDLGAIAAKCVLLRDGEYLAAAITPNEGRLAEAMGEAIDLALEAAGLSKDEVGVVGGTGWAERYIPINHEPHTTINSLAAGVRWAVPAARTVLDIGGLSSTVITLAPQGRVGEYRTNDRCASGTGFYLDLAAQALELEVERLGPVALEATGRAHISAQCAVFGESEIVTHINDGTSVPDIAAGIAHSIGRSVATMTRRLGVEPELVVCGGVAKNEAVVQAVLEELKAEAAALEADPQILGAVGAARLAAGDRPGGQS